MHLLQLLRNQKVMEAIQKGILDPTSQDDVKQYRLSIPPVDINTIPSPCNSDDEEGQNEKKERKKQSLEKARNKLRYMHAQFRQIFGQQMAASSNSQLPTSKDTDVQSSPTALPLRDLNIPPISQPSSAYNTNSCVPSSQKSRLQRIKKEITSTPISPSVHTYHSPNMQVIQPSPVIPSTPSTKTPKKVYKFKNVSARKTHDNSVADIQSNHQQKSTELLLESREDMIDNEYPNWYNCPWQPRTSTPTSNSNEKVYIQLQSPSPDTTQDRTTQDHTLRPTHEVIKESLDVMHNMDDLQFSPSLLKPAGRIQFPSTPAPDFPDNLSYICNHDVVNEGSSSVFLEGWTGERIHENDWKVGKKPWIGNSIGVKQIEKKVKKSYQ